MTPADAAPRTREPGADPPRTVGRSAPAYRRLAFAARAAISLGLIALLAWRLVAETGGGVALASPGWLATAAALVPVAVVVRIASFMLLVNREERVIGARSAAYLTLVGAGAGLFLPGGAGDLFKAALGARSYGSAEKIVASSIVDKLTSLAAVSAMGVAGGLVAGERGLAVLSAAVLALAAAPLVAPGLVPWALAVRLLGGSPVAPERLATAIRTPAGVIVPVLGVSLAGWVVTYTVVLACCRAAGVEVPAGYVYSMAPLITLTGLVPISLAGLGLSQVTMSWLLVSAGAGQTQAISAAVFQLAVNIVPGLLGIALYALRGGGRRR